MIHGPTDNNQSVVSYYELYMNISLWYTKGHFTHKTESPWAIHFKHSHWWRKRSRSKFASHYAWGTNGVCECKMDVKSTWIPTWHWMDHVSCHLDYFQKTPHGGRLNTKPGHHGTPNVHNRWFILLYHVRGPTWRVFGWGTGHIWLHTTLEDPWPHYMILKVPWDGLWTHLLPIWSLNLRAPFIHLHYFKILDWLIKCTHFKNKK